VASVLFGLYVHSIYQARTSLVQKHDFLLASSLNDSIARFLTENEEHPIRVDFHGFIQPESVYPVLPTTTNGASFFEWDGGNPYRMVRYMNMIGFHRYVSISEKDREMLSPLYEEMTVWPLKGSIRIANGVVLVKLSE
jgi:hypothetical protein